MCVRGLKLDILEVDNYFQLVARHVRAWIETLTVERVVENNKSHAMCVRGLKLVSNLKVIPLFPSHAMCVRGLKHKVK